MLIALKRCSHLFVWKALKQRAPDESCIPLAICLICYAIRMAPYGIFIVSVYSLTRVYRVEMMG